MDFELIKQQLRLQDRIVYAAFTVDLVKKYPPKQKAHTTLLMQKKQQYCCKYCSVPATIFVLHRHINEHEDKRRFDAFAKAPDGTFRMMTKDHILPRSKGGTNQHRNLQVMCDECNHKIKKNIISSDEWKLILSNPLLFLSGNRERWIDFFKEVQKKRPEDFLKIHKKFKAKYDFSKMENPNMKRQTPCHV